MLRLIVASVASLAVGVASAAPRWQWEDRFSAEERQVLTAWIEDAHAGLVALLGELPFSYAVRFHRLENRAEPVPWARTHKQHRYRAVDFHVDPSFAPGDFERDWTASHEISHLVFPYLGRDGMWFAEGIASYLQYQAMYAGGAIDWEEAIVRYEDRFRHAARPGRVDGIPIAELPRLVRRTGSYVRLYWGGAAFFLEADRRLHEVRDTRLHQVIRDYLACCFGERGRGAMDMIDSFDRLSESSVFSETYRDTVARPAFPDTRSGLEWLHRNPPPTRPN